ncbi:hypothetical protein AB6A40_009178 [Gnathostoma spinigerum]|uniref:Uncharacterized protein n=1 Tax=Gnathostoma spinigerum TaxID=75299 RepID=A0ABD6ER73_9BILA
MTITVFCIYRKISAIDTFFQPHSTIQKRERISTITTKFHCQFLLPLRRSRSVYLYSTSTVFFFSKDDVNNNLDVRHLCYVINNASNTDPLNPLRAAMDWVNSFVPQTSTVAGQFDNDYWAMISELRSTSFDYKHAALRVWIWMTCNEVGFFQTTDHGKSAFGSMVPLNYYIDMCTDMFGDEVKIGFVRKNNHAARRRWGDADSYNASNIVLLNGELDPWHVLGTYVNIPKQHQLPVLIKGAAHCSDMYPKRSGEPEDLDDVRKTIDEQVAIYLHRSDDL